MREPLGPYKGADVLNYLCLIATELLGESTLRSIPSLAAGFSSVLATLPPTTARALRNIRLSGCAPTTLRDLRLMIDAYCEHHDRRERAARRNETTPEGEPDRHASHVFERRYVVSHDFTVSRRWTHIVPGDIQQALRSLTNPLAPRVKSRPARHDPTLSAEIREDEAGFAARIAPLDFDPPSPPVYDLTHHPRTLDPIRWDELVHMADRFDHLDRTAGRQQPGERNWYQRLYTTAGERSAVLFGATPLGLKPVDHLELRGIKHLIGLPGAGKTTLLYLLAACLHERELRACFLFPSIEVSTAFIEKLATYQVPAALLFGQSEGARAGHVANFASSLASNQHKGLGETRVVAPFFATNCALAAYASDEEEPFPHTDPPCELLEQSDEKRKRRTRQCAMASACGRQFSERTLAESDLWVGHVLSMDRRLSPLFTDAEMHHFEFIARTFDLLVIDECDAAQTSLDARGVPLMKLSGDDASVWSRLISDFHGRAARGRNAFVSRANMPAIFELTGRFGRAAERLTGRVMHFSEHFRKTHERTLLTTVSIISDLFEVEDGEGGRFEPRNAFEKIWDLAAKAVAFGTVPLWDLSDEAEHDPDESHDTDRVLAEAARLADVDLESIRSFYDGLRSALEQWDRDGNETAMQRLAHTLRKAPGLSSSHDDPTFLEYTGLLTTVSLLILQHFGLAPHLRMLNAQGLIGNEVFQQRPSRDQLAILPETLLGRLSGVRYTLNDEGDVDISHIGFVGVPRLLAQRMHALGMEEGEGPAILLTSATSLLEESPSFHVAIGPHYVLKRPHAGDGWIRSHYRFIPQRDPADSSRFLRFSGARMSQRERVLNSIVDQLLRGDALSEVESALRTNDILDGIGRKVGFVVNSYAQCDQLFAYIRSHFPDWHGRVRYLTPPGNHQATPEYALTASQVERLGDSRDWDLLIFPMNAIGRGVNIVYRFGHRIGKAMLGTLYFLTRPHPRTDSLQLMQGLIGRASEQFDRQNFSDTAAALSGLRQERNHHSTRIKQLLRMPLSSQRLGDYARPFVADQMIMILQTIGRAMRGDCPAFVNFVDEAWAPRSAIGRMDDARTSMLVMMRSILQECLNHPDPTRRQCYENLYTSFAAPLNRIEGLLTA